MRQTVVIESRKLEQQLKKALKRNPEVTTKTVTNIAYDLAGRSAKRAPRDTGDLRSNCSAVVNGTLVFEKEKKTGDSPAPKSKIKAEVGYGLPYAVRQHEDMGLHHKDGEPKFLENPFLENEQKYIDKLKAIPKKVLK